MAIPPQSSAEAGASAWADKMAAVRTHELDRSLADDRWSAPEAGPQDQPDRARPPVVQHTAQPWPRWVRAWMLAADLALSLIPLGASLALSPRLTPALQGAQGSEPGFGLRSAIVLVAALAGFAVALGLAGGYELKSMARPAAQLRRVAVAAIVLIAAASTTLLVFEPGGSDLARQARAIVLVGIPGSWLAASLTRLIADRLLRGLRRQGRCRQRVVVIGLERSVAELVRAVRRDPAGEMDVVGACVSSVRAPQIEGVPVFGVPAQARGVVLETGADAVVLTSWSDVSGEDLRRLAWDLEGSGVRLLVAPRLGEVAQPRLNWQHVGGMPLVDVEEPTFTGARRVAKRALDLVGSVVGLLLLSPVLIAVAVAIKVTSAGPMIFRQPRVGRHGEIFVMHKFRSMYTDAEARIAELADLNQHGEGPLFKMAADPRVTAVGGFIRRFSLDELPQLYDVLRGRMSLVGPRPPLEREVVQYENDVRRRLMVTPGITGLWQVSGRSDLSWNESVRLDLNYVENWSLFLDLSIIARTVSAVLAQRGAY
jgi:exopolysaccharide biosynthesis polyprenyl glycosylphosphotransferase